MTPNPSDPRPAARAPEERGGLALAAFCFVIVALIVLVVSPVLVLQRISEANRATTTTVVPAYEAVRDLAFAMEARIAFSRSRFLTGDPAYDIRLERASAAESEALREIEALAPRISDDVVAHVESLRRHMTRRDSLEAGVLAAGEVADAFLAAIPRFDAVRDSMLVEVAGLNRDLARVTQARAAEEERLADLQRSISILLGAVALLAALVVGWFAWRQRRLRREVQRALEEENRQRTIAERRGEELERATEARVRLLQGVTHDVKNPLGAAKGYADLLEMEVRSPLLPEQRPYVEGIQRSVDGALAIIADLLDLARADSGGLSVQRVEVDLTALAAAAVEDHRSAAGSAGHTLELVPPANSLHVYTDPGRVGQVLGNLLSNAIKYTPPPGRIIVQPAVEADDASASWAAVRVSDTGPGIPADRREAIFDEFTRLDDQGAQKGHGLGLAIARRISRLLGGDLSVRDAPSGGSTFVLRLPTRQENDFPGDEEADESGIGGRQQMPV